MITIRSRLIPFLIWGLWMGILPIADAQQLTQDTPSDADIEQELPAWILYRQGEQAYRERRLGVALAFFQRALIEKGEHYPEAEAGIGRVYEAEGRLELAEQRYRRALAQRDAFEIASEELQVRYRLANLSLQRGNRGAFENMLLTITAADMRFNDPAQLTLRNNMRSLLLSEGFDRLALLYRNDALGTYDAHAMLGEHFLRSGNYSRAIMHLIFANLQMVTVGANQIQQQDYFYRYETLGQMLDMIEQSAPLRQFIIFESEWYRTLFYLGAAIYGYNPSSGSWRYIWRTIAERPQAEQWARLAVARLQNPRIEPLFNVR